MLGPLGKWPLVRQLTEGDPSGRGKAAQSRHTAQLRPRTQEAEKMTRSVCPYCAVGCGQRVWSKEGKVTQIEGDPDSPISRGRLCPKGAASEQLVNNPTRLKKVKYRRPNGTEWEELDLDQAMEMIADRVLAARDAGWQDEREGETLRRTLGFAHLGGATLDNEENYLIKKFFTAMGAVQVENQARILHSSTVPSLGTSFGRGGATTFQQDLQHADCILIMGSNMAENHPVGFQWVMEARLQGAKVIHADPRFTRTSAMSNLHVPLRAGTDIAFLGGIINYVLENDRYFREYVVHYTNAPVIVNDEFADTEDMGGLFSGYDPETGSYDTSTWQYKGASVSGAAGKREMGGITGEQAHYAQSSQLEHGEPPEYDDTLQNPRCVFQILRKHYSRYTPEMVERICGTPKELFLEVAEALCENSGRERTSAFVYSVGWTQHTIGVQYIRAAAIIQLLLGNIGRPGGGILALRGHASIQGSTDIPTLYNILPGYLPMPR